MADFEINAVVTIWQSLLDTIVAMSGETPDRVQRASDEGWSLQPQQVDRIVAAKTPTVLELIKKLSYCKDIHVAPSTPPLNYISTEGLEMKDGTSPLQWSDPGNLPDILPEELPLTTQSDGVGSLLILNVHTGQYLDEIETKSHAKLPRHMQDRQ